MDENEARARRFFTEVLDGQRVELVAPDHVHDRADGTEQRGRAARQASAAAWHDAFPDYHLEFEDLIANGDKVAVRFAASGMHQGEYRGYPPTGRHLRWTGIFMYRVAGGKIAQTWVASNLLEQLRQTSAPETTTTQASRPCPRAIGGSRWTRTASMP